MPRYRLTIAYDGTDFSGWQKQEPPDPDAPVPAPGAPDTRRRLQLRTVQHVLEQTIRQVVREPIVLVGASRTDAGVHAQGQVAAFTSEPEPDKGVGWPEARGTDTLVRALNARLPGDLLVRDAAIVVDDFSPISGAVRKEYSYTMHIAPSRPLWDRRYVWHSHKPLDIEAMARAGRDLVGEHDFASFAAINHGKKTTVRTIFSCSVAAIDSPDPGAQRVRLRVCGSGFLYNMVRIIAGTLVQVGRGRLDADAIPVILASRDRRRAGPTLPPEGLRLEWIQYAGDPAHEPGP